MAHCFARQRHDNKTNKSALFMNRIFTFSITLFALISTAAQSAEPTYPDDQKQIVGTAASISEETQSVWVSGPLIDVYAGPGQSYPIVHTLEKGEKLELHKQYTRWIKVTSQSGIDGWIAATDTAKLFDANGRPLTERKPINDHAGRFSLQLALGTFDGDSYGSMGIGYGLSENLRIDGILGHSTDGPLQGRHLYGALTLDLKQFKFVAEKPWQPYASLGYGVYNADGDINGIKNFDTFKSSIGVRYNFFQEIEATFEYSRDVILVTGNNNIHADGLKVGVMTYF